MSWRPSTPADAVPQHPRRPAADRCAGSTLCARSVTFSRCSRLPDPEGSRQAEAYSPGRPAGLWIPGRSRDGLNSRWIDAAADGRARGKTIAAPVDPATGSAPIVRVQMPDQRAGGASVAARVQLARYLAASLSPGRTTGSRASRSADTFGNAARIWPLPCPAGAWSTAKVSRCLRCYR